MRSDSFRASVSSALRSKGGSEQHLDELARDRAGELLANGAVEYDDTAEGGDGIRRERFRVRVLDRLRDGDSARVRVLHDHARRAAQLRGEEPRGGEVVQVVERERLALMLLDVREQVRSRASLRVVRGALVRILPVRELKHAFERRNERLREDLAPLEPARDRRVVGRRPRERNRGEAPAQVGRREHAVRPTAPRAPARNPADDRPRRRDAKLFAAARSNAGPPMSIISTSPSSSSSGRSTASSKG